MDCKPAPVIFENSVEDYYLNNHLSNVLACRKKIYHPPQITVFNMNKTAGGTQGIFESHGCGSIIS